MKWLPTTSILFLAGLICVIAETAVANPWDSFVSGQQIFEAQTIRLNRILKTRIVKVLDNNLGENSAIQINQIT